MLAAMSGKWTIRVSEGHPEDRTFDRTFWQRAGATARWEAAWQLVVDAHARRGGKPDELRLRRTLVTTRQASR